MKKFTQEKNIINNEYKKNAVTKYKWQNLALIILCLSILIFIFGIFIGNSGKLFYSAIDFILDEKISATIQGTVGVAAAIAGAIVTISIANLALDLARASHETAEASFDVSLLGPRRDVENEATRLRRVLIKFQYEFEDALQNLIDVSRIIENNEKLVHLFSARFLVRYENLKKTSRTERDACDADFRTFIFSEIDAARKILIKLNSLKIISQSEVMGDYFTENEIEKFMADYRGAYSGALSVFSDTNIVKLAKSNFIQMTSLNEEIRSNLLMLEDAFKTLKKVIIEIYDHEELYPLIESVNGASFSANVLKNKSRKMTVPETSDSWLDVIGIARFCLEQGPKHAGVDLNVEDTYDENEAKIYSDSRRLYFAFSLLEHINSNEKYCHEIYFNPIWCREILLAVTRLSSVLYTNKDDILDKYNLVIKANNREDYVPIKLRNYAPSQSTVLLTSALNRALQFSDAWQKRINEKHEVPAKIGVGTEDHFGLFDSQTNLMHKFALKVFGLNEHAASLLVAEALENT